MMDDAKIDENELSELLHKLCDARLDAAGYARLAEIMTASDAARQRYIEFIDICIGVAYATPESTDKDPISPPLHGGALQLFDDPSIPPYPPTDSTTHWFANGKSLVDRTSTNLPGWASLQSVGAGLRLMLRMPWLVRAAVILLAVGGVWMAHTALLIWAPPDDALPVDVAAMSEPDYAARIVRITDDTQWKDPDAKLDFLFRIPAHKAIRLASGLVQLEFFSGAVVILHGPAVFTPTGPDSGRLDQGRLIGKVASGNFRLTTQDAEVIDLGTEFGVSVDGVTGTDVLVFDGEVQVVSRPAGAPAGEILNMTEGMAARIRPDGTAEYDFASQPDEFSRSLSQPRNMAGDNELSLVDIICGGNGFDNYLSGSIDPLTGQPDSGVWRKSYGAGRRIGDGVFHPVVKRPPIDGVFVPAQTSKRIQLDTLGSTVDLPPTCGQTAGPIWARRPSSTLEAEDGTLDFWGAGTSQRVVSRLQGTRHGLVAMHANVGLSLDLQAVRLQQHRGVSAFEAVVTNLDNSDQWNPKGLDTSHNTADFRVYVDGMLRYSRVSFRHANGDAEIFVPLLPTDQRLTLLSTEGDGEILYDHVILVDPVLKLDKPTRNQAAE